MKHTLTITFETNGELDENARKSLLCATSLDEVIERLDHINAVHWGVSEPGIEASVGTGASVVHWAPDPGCPEFSTARGDSYTSWGSQVTCSECRKT